MIETTLRLLQEYNITFENHCRLFVDNPSFIRALKDRIDGEDPNYERLIAVLKSNIGANRFTLESMIHNMFVCLSISDKSIETCWRMQRGCWNTAQERLQSMVSGTAS
jgi:hypothetical protein